MRSTAASFVIPAEVEIGIVGLATGGTLSGNDGVQTLFGNGGSDTLLGNGGNDRLEGGVGFDRLDGGTGDDGGADSDNYFVDSAQDIVVELANEGFDQVLSTATVYVLSANVEGGIVATTAGATLVGNELDNLMQGNSGNDSLSGGGGTDTFFGGQGNDQYSVNDTQTAVIVEAVGEGVDVVATFRLSFTLPDNVENGFMPIGIAGGQTLTGNALGNAMASFIGNDRLVGLGGNDTLFGNDGNDTLIGGLNTDTFVYGKGDGHDVITDMTLSQNDVIELQLSSVGIGDLSDPHASQQGDDVLISFPSSMSIRIENMQVSALSQDDFVFS